MTNANVYCCACKATVAATAATGQAVYPHLPHLAAKVFWACPTCRNYVGAHKDTGLPLGFIPTPELRKARQRIHALIDPVWKSREMRRKAIYRGISEALGYEYHTAEIRTMEEAERVLEIASAVISRGAAARGGHRG